MPMSHVFLSGVLTGIVSSLVMVLFCLFRLHQIIFEFFFKNLEELIDIEDLFMLVEILEDNMELKAFTWDLLLHF